MPPLRARLVLGLLALGACRAPGGAPISEPPVSQALHAAPTMQNVDARFLPALELLQSAVRAGEDDAARAILEQVLARGPDGPTLEVARAFQRILDGRAAVRALELTLETRDEADAPGPQTPGRAAPDLRRLELVLRNTGPVPLRLAPGPATLVVEHEVLGVDGGLTSASEAKSFENLRSFELPPGAEARASLSIFFLELGAGSIAERLRFRLELRAGTVERDGQALPAMRFAVPEAEELALSPQLLARAPALAGQLVELVRAGRVRAAGALEIALRLPQNERAAALDGLATLAPDLPETDLSELVPTLRWLSSTSAPGGDPAAWREWLEQRLRGPRSKDDGRLVLPARPR